MKVFLDTNVVIDFFAKREDFFFPASVILDLGYHQRIELYASALTFVNAFYVLRKTYRVQELREKLSSLSDVCHITRVDEQMVRLALAYPNMDFEDDVQIVSAQSVEPEVIVTRNEKHFKGLEMRIQSPTDFLNDFFADDNHKT